MGHVLPGEFRDGEGHSKPGAAIIDPMKIPSLLAPVRNRASFAAALRNGADAVYLGVGELNMRASSSGIIPADLKKITRQAARQGVEVFVALNVIVYDHEMERVSEILDICREAGADAVICQDPAVINLCREKGIPIHISTQANISNLTAARFYQGLGARAVVLARELTLEQIAAIKSGTSLKIEVFGHGAMCVSISGRCFLSQFLSGCSANRGECDQPCRRTYRIMDIEENRKELLVEEGHLLSPKDLCTIHILDKIAAAGVDYLKIEGRSRSHEYIATVTSSYRKALDALQAGRYTPELCDELLRDLRKVYNRKFSEGFLFGRPGSEGWTRSGDNQARERKETLGLITNYYRKNKVAEMVIHSGELNRGDQVYVQGNLTGSVRLTIEEIEYHEGNLVTFLTPLKLRRGDRTYKIVSLD